MKTKIEAQAELLQKMQSLSARADAALTKAAELETKGANAIMSGSTPSNLPVSGGSHTSDEQRAMRAFGCKSVSQLISVNTGLPGFKNVDPYLKDIVKELKKDVDVSRYIAQICHGSPLDRIGKETEKGDMIARVKNIGETHYGREVLIPKLKAFQSGASPANDWVPLLLAANYIEEFQIDPVLESRFQKIQMPSPVYKQPIQVGLNKARISSENVSMTDSTFGTSNLTFTAHKLAEYHILTEEVTEDTAPDILAAARDHVIMAQIRAIESALINGDDDGTHIDSDTQAGAADLCEKVFKGLRRQAIANAPNGSTTDFANGAVSEALLRTLRSRMGKFGVNPNELLFITGAIVLQQMVSLPSVITVEKFGPMATVLKGALAAYQAIPIVTSEHMREDLNASGVFDGVTTSRAGLLLVNLKRWYVGIRRPIMVKAMQDLPMNDRFLLASYQRKDFQGFVQGAVEKSVGYGYNIAT